MYPASLRSAAATLTLVVLAACSASNGTHDTGSVSASSAGAGGAGGQAATTASTSSASTASAGGSFVAGSSGSPAAGVGGGGMCTPDATPPPGDCGALGIQIAAPFTNDYSCVDLGTVPSVPAPWGGFAVKANEPSTLLITAAARTPGGRLFAVPIGRDSDCHVSGFTGVSTDIAEAPYNEAGIAYGPGGVLFLAQAVVNQLGQLKPGSTVTNKVVNMAALGVTDTMCGVGFVPTGFPGEGGLKLINWPSPGSWYDAPYTADGTGTYNINGATQMAMLPNGAAGFVFIAAGNPDFPNNTVLVSEYDIGIVAAYDLVGMSDPDPATRKPFITGLSGAQGGVVDPVSGDFLFSTYITARIIAIRGFKPPPPPPN